MAKRLRLEQHKLGCSLACPATFGPSAIINHASSGDGDGDGSAGTGCQDKWRTASGWRRQRRQGCCCRQWHAQPPSETGCGGATFSRSVARNLVISAIEYVQQSGFVQTLHPHLSHSSSFGSSTPSQPFGGKFEIHAGQSRCQQRRRRQQIDERIESPFEPEWKAAAT